MTTTSKETIALNASFGDMCLPDLLRMQAATHPDRTAVSYGDENLTFAQLAARSEGLADHLGQLGVTPDQCVGIFMDPSIDLMVGVWGVLHAGGAYLPLSPEYPEERLRYMLADSRTTVVLADEALRSRLIDLAPPGTRVLTLADTAADAHRHGHRAGALRRGPRPDNLAYIIYTSGSTGSPKGIMIEHRSIVSQMRWLTTAQGLDQRRTVLQKTPLSFDAAQWEILAPACGSRVVMGDPGAYRDPERLIELIVAHGVTTLQGVPTLLQALVDTDELPRCTSLTQVFSGGEALTRSLAVHLLDALPACELVNLYGPSECTINSSAHAVSRDTVREGPDTVSIGTPVHDTTYRILDGNGSPVAIGETGELYVGGVQLARGYLHRPDLTAERFVRDPFAADHESTRLYRTGDLARWNLDGTVQFVGRADNQVKLRGFRVELDEIRMAVEAHDWVKHAAVIVRDDARTGANLVAFIELNPKEAALMDQSHHGAHHQSKRSQLAIRAQLANPGCRDDHDLAGRRRVDLPGRTPTTDQRARVFARKTYRFFEGDDVRAEDILALLDRRIPMAVPRGLDAVTAPELGEILRYFGQFHSDERLLPKYGYASPGSLYAVQMYLEVSGVAGIAPGHYYYHPVHHQLVLIRPGCALGPRLRLHFIGRTCAIAQVYRTNVAEVLHFEAGHLLGLFDTVLPAYGLSIRTAEAMPTVKALLSCADEDHYLGTFDVVPFEEPAPEHRVDVCVQAHPGKVADLPAGQYRYSAGRLDRVSDELVQKRHVIAINQPVYERASLGITLLSRNPDVWMRYVDLGRALAHLQANDVGLGFMSSGYSSETGHDLPSARRIASILGDDGAYASYFALGGPVSDAQRRSQGMKEDIVHMKGPAEMIRDALAERLPAYMIPNRVTVLDALPLTANGKVDVQSLREIDEATNDVADTPFVAPRTATEEAIARLWRQAMKTDTVSVRDDFFACGGNSLIAVRLIGRINRKLGNALPLQVLFESPTIEALARRVDRTGGGTCSRLVRLSSEGSREPVFCWPGLGGYPMNLRLLAGSVRLDRPFFGIQAHGINPGETAYPTIREMAAKDLEIIKRRQPVGPYTLWGYSFGARVAFEAAYQLEQAGDRVENLFLIAPGQPLVGRAGGTAGRRTPTFDDAAFVTILLSVFAGRLDHPALGECLENATDEDAFVAFVSERFDHPRDLVRRIVAVVRRTFQFDYTFHELAHRRIDAPVTIFKARSDDYSFIENSRGYSADPPAVVDLDADHYGLLRTPGIDDLVNAIRAASTSTQRTLLCHTSTSSISPYRSAGPAVAVDRGRHRHREHGLLLRRGSDFDRAGTRRARRLERARVRPQDGGSQAVALQDAELLDGR